MSEFDLIHQYFTRPTRHTNLSVGDDAALISITKGMELAISADMLVAGTHFFADCDPYQLGWKSLAVNVSDMAAMGANPKWATLAIALPEVNQPWLAEFSKGFFACADDFNVDLIGGDTTRGPLTISVQIMGEVPAGKAIKRSGAKVNDEIWVSGTLGDAAMALAVMQQRFNLARSDLNQIENALHTPQPRVALGQALHGVANSAIDISDGLLADLGHILKASKLGAIIRLDQVPISDTVHKNLHLKQVKNMVLAGGDDYELCFTAPSNQHAEIANLSKTLNLALSHIGQITANTDLIVRGLDNEILDIKETGFDHFN
ncbi:thiamine-phosphate kinase [Methylotenera sp.]|uniref:thiamine-phosphate kinase n=2 Tax=Methylotenera sp. TaxID=2051956 RepID=UPI002728A0EB|nr:thiamine-phosphate kinase [Methylotenera sp.]MDO9206225.1 thiamine-phosphate kinase [Methylotenera sp.]MDP1521649.1 thiamine-phosphate kinase [Methylotenera sp.]MDP2070849.1 thiamine-phosphate kinase [Methylotenera sp.]MDP2230204.1 thiamine-phosphate kinase [Methylotenera sp.]MDP3005723.1 thiamine-phosphate kinase [Methylotenera sp.]